MKTAIINQPITVTAIRFGRKFEPIPTRIEFGGRSVNFIDEGIHIAVKSGGAITRLFDMSDGHSRFRLRQPAGSQEWQLLSINDC